MRARPSVYLDYLARSLGGTMTDVQTTNREASCGLWATVGQCESEHLVAKTVLCRREWCGDCGAKDSAAHKRRWAAWLPKAQQMEVMGYLVVTFPESIRQTLRTKQALSSMATGVTAILKRAGFRRGLRRWHYFGDESTRFNPHLNFLLSAGYIAPSMMNLLKRELLALVGESVVIHYQYTDEPGKMLHLLKYVTRATFLQRSWDEEFAQEIYGFRNTWSFGLFNGIPFWDIDHVENDVRPEIQAIDSSLCPFCSGKLSWSQGVTSAASLTTGYWSDLGDGYYMQDGSGGPPVTDGEHPYPGERETPIPPFDVVVGDVVVTVPSLLPDPWGELSSTLVALAYGPDAQLAFPGLVTRQHWQ